MEGLIEFLGRNLVDTPDAVSVRGLRNDRYATVVRLTVGPDDLGKVIGRQGRVAKAMRTLMRASASMQGKRHIGLELDEAAGAAGEPAAEAGSGSEASADSEQETGPETEPHVEPELQPGAEPESEHSD
jgi:hypothetical protein